MRRRGTIGSTLFLALALLLPAAAQAQEQPEVTLGSLLEAGRRTHPTLAKKPLLARSLELTKSEINRDYWPKTTLGGHATWQSEVTSIDIPVPGVDSPTPPKARFGATLDIRQNLWDGGVASQKKRLAETQSDVEQEKANVEWHQVEERILNLYFAGLVQQELKEQAKTLHERLGKVVQNAEVALENGLLTERDLLLAQARQLEASQAVVEADAQLSGVRESLADLTGVSLSADAKLVASQLSCSDGAAPLSAENVHRPELDMLSAQSDVLEAQEKLNRAADLPKFEAFGTVGYARPGLDFLQDSFTPYFIGGARLTVPLTFLYAGSWQRGDKQLVVSRALVSLERERVVNQIKLQAHTQTSELARLDGALALDGRLVELRKQARIQTELQLEMGTASMTDLISDLSEEDRAKVNLAVHRAQRNLACHELALIRGDE